MKCRWQPLRADYIVGINLKRCDSRSVHPYTHTHSNNMLVYIYESTSELSKTTLATAFHSRLLFAFSLENDRGLTKNDTPLNMVCAHDAFIHVSSVILLASNVER